MSAARRVALFALALVVAAAFLVGELPARASADALTVDETTAPAAAPAPGALTVEQAVAMALERNRDAIAARLDIAAAELDVVAARLYPNPILSYGVGNLVLGKGNAEGAAPQDPGFASQPVQSVGLSEIIDVWAKRSARSLAAERGVEHRRLLVADALREIVYAVRTAFADLTREQAERQLALETAERYAETVRLSRARFQAGDISESELRKIELEGFRYTSAVIDADLELGVARQRLAALLGVAQADDLPAQADAPVEPRRTYAAASLIASALQHRPDVRAARSSRGLAETQLRAARREAYPDLDLGAAFTHSNFTVSGDNPNTLALSLSVPLPLFDRNQAGVGRSALDIRRADNELERLRIVVAEQVTDAVRRAARAEALLDIFEGGLIARAEQSLRVAERSYQAGALSLLELLEAQRTYLDVRVQHLRAVHEHRQAAIEVTHAVGEP